MWPAWTASSTPPTPNAAASSTSTRPGIDPHKASWTAAVVDAALQPLEPCGSRLARRAIKLVGLPTAGRARPGQSRVPAGSVRRCWPGRPPMGWTRWTYAKLAARVRLLSSGHGRKNDNPPHTHTHTHTQPTPSRSGSPRDDRPTAANRAGIGSQLAARSSPGSGPSAGSARPRRSPRSTAPRRSKCPPATSSATGYPGPGTGN